MHASQRTTHTFFFCIFQWIACYQTQDYAWLCTHVTIATKFECAHALSTDLIPEILTHTHTDDNILKIGEEWSSEEELVRVVANMKRQWTLDIDFRWYRMFSTKPKKFRTLFILYAYSVNPGPPDLFQCALNTFTTNCAYCACASHSPASNYLYIT